MEALDPRSFKDWSEAFQHPIPTVRIIEQRVRGHADENRQKLRTLVGASYRDLLGTADRIIQMDEQIQLVESNLGSAGQKCNSRAVEKLFANYAKFGSEIRSRNTERNSLASHLSILQSCATVISRLLKRGGSPLLASKVLVLSRLTYNILSQEDEVSPLVISLRGRLAALRRKLLGIIDQRLSNPDTEWRNLVDDMCAFSLTKSATPTDILRHFHRVRLEAIGSRLNDKEHVKDNALKAVKLLVRTLNASQVIFPKRLADALMQLKDFPLMQQKDVLSLTELRLAVHEKWMAEELRNYTPWPRHDELRKTEADEQLDAWAKQALRKFTSGLKISLSRQDDFGEVMQLRRELFEAWPWNGNRLAGMDSSDVIDDLRDLLTGRLKAIIHSRVQNLSLLPMAISEVLESLQAQNVNSSSLWDSGISSMDINNGATAFKKKLVNSYHGEDASSPHIIQRYDQWMDNVSSLQSSIKEMREIRWNDDILDDIDDVGLDSRQILLSSDDPRELEESLAGSLSAAFKDLEKELHKLVSQILRDDSNTTVPKCLILLRVIREVVRRGTVQTTRSQSQGPSAQIGRAVVDPLHMRLADFVTTSAIERYELSLTKFVQAQGISVTILWEGSPPLPVQPSPMIFRFFHDLAARMSSCGGDVWATGAVAAVKEIAGKRVCTLTQQAVNKPGGFLTANVDEKDQRDDESILSDVQKGTSTQTEKATQLLFDLFYAQNALQTAAKEGVIFFSPVQDLTLASALDGLHIARIQKSAAEYWRRTYLMFALLASS